MSSKCHCGKGHASEYDGCCRFCREKKVSRAQAKAVGVKRRGDGMTITEYRVAIGELNKKALYA